MKLGFEEEQRPYESPSQSARVWTETWVKAHVFCPNCGRVDLGKYANNTPVADFHCTFCKEDYELKSQKAKFGASVMDGAYRTMIERLAASNNPNLMLLRYDLARFGVTDLCVVPKHFFVQDIIQKRKPLALTARRAGWTGCNILLGRVPEAGKIYIVRDGQIAARDAVLDQWRQTLFLRDENPEARGWLIEVMKCIEDIGRSDFDLDDVYSYEARLAALYPNNRNVRPKIRQQLQFLRDRGYLEFISSGRYRLSAAR